MTDDPVTGGGGRRDQDLPPAQGERFVRGLKIGIADGIEHDVGALAAGEFAHARRDVGRGGIDDFDGRIGVAFVCFVPAHHADHPRAVPARDLYRRLPDLAVDAHDQHGLACLGDAGAPQAFHRGDKGHADAGGLLPGNARGLLHHGVGLDHEMRGMGAVTANAEIAGRAEHLAPDPPRRPSITTPA